MLVSWAYVEFEKATALNEITELKIKWVKMSAGSSITL